MVAAVIARSSRVRILARVRSRRLNRFRRKPQGPTGLVGRIDQAILRALRTRGHDPLTESAFKALGHAGEYAAIWVAIGLAGAAADPGKRRRWLLGAGTGPGAIVANYAIKVLVGRERPLIDDHPALAKAPSKLSFPSAHATSSLAAATAFGRVEPRTRLPLYTLAGAICFSRPYLGMHYPSDVLAGIALGTLIGGLVPAVGERTLEERMLEFVSDRAHEHAEAEATE